MKLTNIFGHWINVNNICELIQSSDINDTLFTNIYFTSSELLTIHNKTADEVAHEINRKSAQKDNETDDFKFELRPISEIETVTDYNRDKDVLVKLSEYSYGSYNFNYVLQNYSKSYWTHFALLP